MLMAVAAALLGVGVLMTTSAGQTVGRGVSDDASFWATVFSTAWGRHAVFALVAVGAMLVGYSLDVRGVFGFGQKRSDASLRSASAWGNRWGGVAGVLGSPLLWVMVVAFGCVALTFVPGLGKNVNGASRWLVVPGVGLSFQPSEVMKWAMVIALAWWCARRRGVMHRFWWGLVPALFLLGLGAGMVLIEDLGTGALIGAVGIAVIVAGGARWWQVGLLLPIGIAGLVGAIVTSPYRVKRLLAFMDPWADPMGIGYHPIQSMLAFAQGGLFGRGMGNSIQKYHLPEDTTDFIFPILCEEWGLAGAALVLALYVAIWWLSMGIVAECRDTFRRLIGLGVLLTIGLQAIMNIAVVTVVVPTKGIALPLISAGGTGWIMTAFMLGVLASLDHAAAVEEQDAPVDVSEPNGSVALSAYRVGAS